MKLIRLLLLAGAGAASSLTVQAQEWTRFRGPNGTGISLTKGIPVQWTEKDLLFKTQLPAAGHSSPVLWGNKVFLTGADNDVTAHRSVFCLDATTGELLWNRTYPSEFHKRHQYNSFASATPAVDADRVYVAWSTPSSYTLRAFDHDGQELWQRDLGPYLSQHSCGSSPILYEGLVILINEQDKNSETDKNAHGVSTLHAFDCKTGEPRWKVDRQSELVTYSTPCVRETKAGVELIFNSKAHGMTGIDARTGAVKWEAPGILDKRSCSSPVILDNGLITASCGSGGGGNYLVTVDPAAPGQPARVAYRVDRKAPYVPTPIARDGLLFLISDDGVASCLRQDDGTEVWRERVGGTFFGSPIWVDGKIYAVNAGGEVVVLQAGEEFKVLGRTELNDLCHTTPAVANGRLYIRTYEHLLAIGAK